MKQRESGILLHLTSLPSNYGIGDLGKNAFKFVDFLSNAGQRLWQILPINPTGFKDSPYQSFSTFAGNPLLIDLDNLVVLGFIESNSLENLPDFKTEEVDYEKVIPFKNRIMKQAYKTFKEKRFHPLKKDFYEFRSKNESWLRDYALFMAVKNHFIEFRSTEKGRFDQELYKNQHAEFLTENQLDDYYYGAVWQSWPKDLATRKPHSIEKWTSILKKEIGYYEFIQWIFNKQYEELKQYANKKNVKIIGDIPIFVALDSADCWSNPELFLLDSTGSPTGVAGVPPDYFSEDGQLWGNPLYNWQTMQNTNFQWWINRIKRFLELSDYIRIDHFRGFDSFWNVKYGAQTAKIGRWEKAPGVALFTAIKKEFPDLPIIAEDLGVITEDVETLRDEFSLPGMKVMQFGFDGAQNNIHLPMHFQTNHTVVYTGTHDNDTTQSWYEKLPFHIKIQVKRYLDSEGEDIPHKMIRCALLSIGDKVIIPMQDLLSQGENYRMNTPGTSTGNWQYRITADALSPKLEKLLKDFNYISDRNL